MDDLKCRDCGGVADVEYGRMPKGERWWVRCKDIECASITPNRRTEEEARADCEAVIRSKADDDAGTTDQGEGR